MADLHLKIIVSKPDSSLNRNLGTNFSKCQLEPIDNQSSDHAEYLELLKSSPIFVGEIELWKEHLSTFEGRMGIPIIYTYTFEGAPVYTFYRIVENKTEANPETWMGYFWNKLTWK